MRLKCLFCKYKKICLPEMKDGLTQYSRLIQKHKQLLNKYSFIVEAYVDLRAKLENYIAEHESHE